MQDLVIRDMLPGEENFIYNSWLHSYRSSQFARPIESKTYYAFHHAIIERLLARTTTNVLIAAHSATPDVILGYLVLETPSHMPLNCATMPVAHFLYVKQPFRRLGIAKALVAHLKPKLGAFEAMYTHKTNDGEGLANSAASSEELKALYNPYLI